MTNDLLSEARRVSRMKLSLVPDPTQRRKRQFAMRAAFHGPRIGAFGVGMIGWVGLIVSMPACQRDAVPQGCPTCAAAQPVNGWCDACAVGYVAGLPIKSKLLYDTMDAHGHTLQVELMPCKECQRLAKVGGYCEASHIGWYQGEAYFSRLTYEIARAYYREPSCIDCAACRENAKSAGWCDECGYGMIGRFAFTVRADYDAAEKDFRRLRNAIELSNRCDYCAMAAVTDTGCFKCKTEFRNGEPVAAVAP
ncbi:MAG: hypothetical protein H6820_14440 [Phycisphaerales bacterium]|nr:hypothetical protein [Phycisphaerales bacterium]